MMFDQHEFDSPDAEQSLELVISSPSQHQDLEALLASLGATARRGASPSHGWHQWNSIRENLRRFAHIELPRLDQCREALILRDEWHDVEFGVAFSRYVIWYHWTTSA